MSDETGDPEQMSHTVGETRQVKLSVHLMVGDTNRNSKTTDRTGAQDCQRIKKSRPS